MAALIALLMGAIAATGAPPSFAATSGIPLPPFHECPTVGGSASCQILLVVNADNTVSVYGDTAVGTYDGADDTLVGIRNESSSAVHAVTVSGPGSALAGFDGDGLCAYVSDARCPYGSTGYEGPGVTFVTDPASTDRVEVNLGQTGLAPQASTYFSLEGALTSAVVTAVRGHLDGSSDVQCAALYFLGAAGSGQDTSQAGVGQGMGPQVYSAFSRLQSVVGAGRSVEGHALGYAAAPVSTLAGSPSLYFNSISVGVLLAKSTLRLHRMECPAQHIVLAGYSQGAMVMHRVLQDLVAAGDFETLRRIDGVLLIADGDRVTWDRTTNWGSATPLGQGIGQFFPSISGSRDTKFPAYLQNRVHRICNRLDPVCDELETASLAATIAFRLKIHTGYTGQAPLLNAADAVAHEVRTTPAPSAGLADLSAQAGVPYSYKLSADLDSSFSPEWRLVAPSTLPPGWTLAPDGTVTGTTNYVGTWTSQVEVRSTILGVTGDWIPATVSWTISA